MESEDQMSNFGFSSSGFIILGTPGVVVKKKRKKKDNGIERIPLLSSILCPGEAKCLILKSLVGCISPSWKGSAGLGPRQHSSWSHTQLWIHGWKCELRCHVDSPAFFQVYTSSNCIAMNVQLVLKDVIYLWFCHQFYAQVSLTTSWKMTT